MNAILLVVTGLSLLVAGFMSAIAWRMTREERRRSDARVAALSSAIYEENGVEEYWIVDTTRREVTVYSLTGQRFGRGKVYAARDTLHSRVLDGFTLHVRDVFV